MRLWGGSSDRNASTFVGPHRIEGDVEDIGDGSDGREGRGRESWAEAALRECREETGSKARIDDLLGIYSDPVTQVHRYPGGTLRQFVGVVFMATAVRRVGPVGDEATELRWVTSDDVPEPLFAPDRPVLRDAFDRAGARP